MGGETEEETEGKERGREGERDGGERGSGEMGGETEGRGVMADTERWIVSATARPRSPIRNQPLRGDHQCFYTGAQSTAPLRGRENTQDSWMAQDSPPGLTNVRCQGRGERPFRQPGWAEAHSIHLSSEPSAQVIPH